MTTNASWRSRAAPWLFLAAGVATIVGSLPVMALGAQIVEAVFAVEIERSAPAATATTDKALCERPARSPNI